MNDTNSPVGRASLWILTVGFVCGLIGCGGPNTKPALPQSGKASSGAVATVQTQNSAAPEPIPPERIAELIAALESGRAKAEDFRSDKVTPAAANAAVPGLSEALKNKNPSVRREAIKVLQQYIWSGSGELTALKSTESALIAALKDQDAGIRKEAIEALMSAPGTKDKASLFIEPLKDADHFVRMRAAAALGQIGSAAKDAVPALAAAMADANEIVRGTAAHALVQIGFPAVPALVKELRHQDTDVCRRAAYALAEIGPAAKEALPELKEASKRRDQVVAALSLWALTMIDRKNHPPQEAVRALVEIMKSSGEVQVRGGAAFALGRIGPDAKAALPLLIEAIKQPDFRLNQPAFFAIGQMGAEAKDAVPALVQAMHHDYPGDLWPNFRAVETLGNIGPAVQAAVPDLIKALKGGERSSGGGSMREKAAEALGKIGPADRVVPVLVETLKEEKSIVLRQHAIRGLGALGPAGKAAVPALADALKQGHQGGMSWQAAPALAAMGADGLAALISAVKEQEYQIRQPALEALARLGPKAKAAVPALIELLNDEDPYRRQRVGDALKKIDPETAAKLSLP